MAHNATDKPFRFYVSRTAGLKLELDTPAYLNIEAGFNDAIHAKAFAAVIADGLNFVIIYDGNGKMLWTFSPGTKIA